MGPFGTLLALVLLGVVAAYVLASLIFRWLEEIGSDWLRLKPALTPQKHPYKRQISLLE